MKNNKGKTALITGASGGIGYEIAKLSAKDGINLILVARRKELLEKIRVEFKPYGIVFNVLTSIFPSRARQRSYMIFATKKISRLIIW